MLALACLLCSVSATCLASTFPASRPIQPCDPTADYKIEIGDVSIDPFPLRKGQLATFSFEYRVSSDVYLPLTTAILHIQSAPFPLFIGSRDLGNVCEQIGLNDYECSTFESTDWEQQTVSYMVPTLGVVMDGTYCGYLEIFEGVSLVGCAGFNIQLVTPH